MNRNSLADYAAFSLLKVFGPLLRLLPKDLSFALGRLLGDLVFLFDWKHRAVVYSNLRTAFAGRMSPAELRRTVRKFFRSFGQNLIEVFLIPTIDARYMQRYVRFDGLEHIAGAFAQKKGVLLCSVHAGSWELANILSANLGFPFSMFVREQKFPLSEGLLNEYRKSKGCRLIQREDQLRELIRVLKNNESTGLTIDQGGRNGVPVSFFGKEASMSPGAVKLALKYGCALVPVFFRRVNGPHLEIVIDEPFALKRTGDPEKDVAVNLQGLVRLFEQHISRSPHEYLWSYKVWKYSGERKILILSDGKVGHLRQSQALAQVAAEVLAEKGFKASISVVEVGYKSGFSRAAASLLNIFSGKHICRGCLLCLRRFLQPDSYAALVKEKFDLVISCGSALSAPNYILARENACRSFVIMRPSFAPLNRFDLVVMAEHDRPPRAANVVRVAGALNLVDEAYLHEQGQQLRQFIGGDVRSPAQVEGPGRPRVRIGFLIGGDSKEFKLKAETVGNICRQLNAAAARCGADLFVTTSRRSSPEVESAVKAECASARMLVIANEKNLACAVGGLLAVCSVVVCSPESISMISEAASSGAHVVVFSSEGLRSRHRAFLESLCKKGHIHLVGADAVAQAIERIVTQKPKHAVLADRERVRQSVRKVMR
jgi:lauroyl/myristoyl acyltransferase/mitochondrial fission protein ELM1